MDENTPDTPKRGRGRPKGSKNKGQRKKAPKKDVIRKEKIIAVTKGKKRGPKGARKATRIRPRDEKETPKRVTMETDVVIPEVLTGEECGLKSTLKVEFIERDDGTIMEAVAEDAALQSARRDMDPKKFAIFQDWHTAYLNDPEERGPQVIFEAYGFKDRGMTSYQARNWTKKYELARVRRRITKDAHVKAQKSLNFSKEAFVKNQYITLMKLHGQATGLLDQDSPSFNPKYLPQNYFEAFGTVAKVQELAKQLFDFTVIEGDESHDRQEMPTVSLESIDALAEWATAERIAANQKKLAPPQKTDADRREELLKELADIESRQKPKKSEKNPLKAVG